MVDKLFIEQLPELLAMEKVPENPIFAPFPTEDYSLAGTIYHELTKKLFYLGLQFEKEAEELKEESDRVKRIALLAKSKLCHQILGFCIREELGLFGAGDVYMNVFAGWQVGTRKIGPGLGIMFMVG